MSKLTQSYWNKRYLKNDAIWDIGEVSNPLKQYFDQLQNKDIKILIPGCGNAYEVVYLMQHGFTDITALDYADQPIENLKKQIGGCEAVKVIQDDFFAHKGSYDLIIEQTFFCALQPVLRKKYVEKMLSLLNTNGKLVGVLFNKDFEKEDPPFGGNLYEYKKLFQDGFALKTIEPCYNSHPKRSGNELFISMQKA